MAKVLAKYLHPAAIATVGGFEFNPKGLVEGSMAGSHKSPFHGFSVEFAGHRQYIPGDDVKHIDWVVYYKRERYMIKQYEAETNLVAQILLDVSESMRYTSHKVTKLDYASYLAVGLSYLITKVRDSVGMAIFDEKIIRYERPSNSLGLVYKLSTILEEQKPLKKTEVSRTLLDFANRIGRRQIAIIISDMLTDPDDIIKGLARLRYDRHEIVLFHVLDPYELDFPFEGRIKFIGMEEFPELKLNPKQIRNAYLKKVEAHNLKLREACEHNNAEYVLVRTDRPVQEALYSYLTSRLTYLTR